MVNRPPGNGEFALMDLQQFQRNRANFPPEELARYAGNYVAWSPDGSRIIASADNLIALAAQVKATNYEPAECVLSSVPLADEVLLGGF
jgi:hypothetical protein